MMATQLETLHKFYQTTTLEELVVAQAQQIERLQEQLYNLRNPLTYTTRDA